MTISPRRSMTMGQLAQLYGGNPNVSPEQVGSNIFLGSSQGADYLNQQGQNLGIGDPAQYFQHQRTAQQMAATPSGGIMEALRIAGQYSPQSLPGQLAARDKMFQETAPVASLQQQYPLPQPGITPTLSPVMQAAAAQQGMDPTAFLMNQRLGNDRSAVSPFSSVPSGQVSSEDLYHQPSFQAAMQNDPAKASRIFGALTGGNLGMFHKSYTDARAQEQQFRDKTLREALASGDASVDDKGNVTWRKKTFDSMTNKMVPTDQFQSGDAFQRLTAGSISRVAPEVQRFHELAAKGGPTAPPVGVATLQQGNVPQQLQGAPGAFGQTLDTITGSISDVLRIGGGGMSFAGTPHPEDFSRSQGSAIQHAAPLLRNNPQFQALMQRDPARARRLIMAIQMGGNSPAAPTNEFGGY